MYFWVLGRNGNLAFYRSSNYTNGADVDGCFSADALLNSRPNDVLFFYALSRYMSKEGCRAVSYGVSSFQAVSNKDGLHAFKTKVGFEAIPIHRAFALHLLDYHFVWMLMLGIDLLSFVRYRKL
jgi:hypothetical protein